ncbi:MAG: ribbon-helix-helix protein, CopG family [Myxococcales bacterium]|nr:ribbon-helix-helix protein, CopG family [Myxococcales bacterium]
MKPVQIVMDEQLLARLDRAARRRKLSRSAFIRQSVEAALSSDQLQALVEAERQAYRKQPLSAAERAAFRELSKAQERVLQGLSRGERW